jgi:hypothetical protein
VHRIPPAKSCEWIEDDQNTGTQMPLTWGLLVAMDDAPVSCGALVKRVRNRVPRPRMRMGSLL